jgi:hypothetical protein
MRLVDLTGERFGRLVVVERVPTDTKRGNARWLSRCDCGGSATSDGSDLRRGNVQSCGCLRHELVTARAFAMLRHAPITHGRTRTPEWNSWYAMKSRCVNRNLKGWKDYGGRGITVCDEWLHDFQAFYDHIGPKPGPGYSVDRIDNNGNYEPGNVRWATPLEQNHNRRPPKRGKSRDVTHSESRGS